MATRDIIFAAAGTAGEATYVEDVFSTYLYTGTGTTQTITNGIQLGDSSVIASQSSTALPTSTNRNYQFVAGGNGIYVAQAYLAGSPFASNYYATSTDGVTWTNQTSLPASYLWYGLAFGNGVFVMTTQYDASAEKAIYSSDGLNWSTASGYPSNYKSSGTYFINGEFFSVNNDINSFGQTIYRSSNGTSWSSVSVNAGSSTQYLKMAYGAGIYILTGNVNTVYSSNLSSWSINSVGNLFEIAFGNGKFIARTTSNALVTSTDGINWTTVQASGFSIGNITFNGSLFLGSDSSGKIYWSSDGINWTSNSTVSTTSLVNTTLSGKTVFIGTGNGARSAVVVDSFTPASLGKGGLVWTKPRNNAFEYHHLVDTVRGGNNALYSNDTSAQSTASTYITSFNSNGFTLGTSTGMNGSGLSMCSWTFRKAPKFFDIVTYTGNGDADRNIAHNLGSVPGMIFIKKTSGTGNWATAASLSSTVYGIGGGGAGSGYEFSLNLTDGYYDNPLKSTIATDTTVNVPRVYYNNAAICNQSGATYVMYLFASNAGGFGAAGTDNIISCGSFTTNGSGVATVSLGYEPQYVMFKRSNSTGSWFILDTMRGWSMSTDARLLAESSTSESNTELGNPTATGFYVEGAASANYIYMAIRRGPMKRPTSGTSVFQPLRYAGNNASSRVISTGKTFPTDWLLTFDTENGASGSGTSYNSPDITRLTGFGVNPPYLRTNSTIAEQSEVNRITLNNSNFDYTVSATSGQLNSTGSNYTNWNIGRAPGFFDVVCYTGTGTATNYTHNLGVVPELYIIKRRSASASWIVGGTVFPSATANYIPLEDIALQTQSNTWQTPTATTFGIGTAFQSDNTFNASGSTYIAYLFATLAGVSKVGSYTGTGSTQTINAGLPTGARFVLIKRTDSTGNWWAWDTAFGMVAGNDTRIAINQTAQIVNQNWVYTTTNGFQIVTSDASVNANGGTYIYLAIA